MAMGMAGWFLEKPELRPFYEELTSRRAARRKNGG